MPGAGGSHMRLALPTLQNFYYAATCSAIHPDDKLVECVSGGQQREGKKCMVPKTR